MGTPSGVFVRFPPSGDEWQLVPGDLAGRQPTLRSSSSTFPTRSVS